jgi:hypothetical protein
MVDAEYEAHWDCPKCGNRTDETEQEFIDFDNGEVFDVICLHDIDKGNADFEECKHEYQVNLRG